MNILSYLSLAALLISSGFLNIIFIVPQWGNQFSAFFPLHCEHTRESEGCHLGHPGSS